MCSHLERHGQRLVRSTEAVVLSHTGAAAGIRADTAEVEDSRHSHSLPEELHNQVLAVGHHSHRCREVEVSGRHRDCSDLISL